MTPIFIAALIVGWVVVSFVACVAVCMASSRFSARVEQQAFEREHTRLRQAEARRVRRPIAVRMENGAGPVKVKVG
jgi:uncharacterized protein YqfA (UPF0365 family)